MPFAEFSKSLGRHEGPGDPDAYELLGLLRESAPIAKVPAPTGEGFVWLVTSYELARSCLGDGRLSFDPRNASVPQHAPGRSPYVLAKDAPEHTALRGLVAAQFSPGHIERMRPRINEICEELLSDLTAESEVDLVEGYALAIPETVTYELFGIPEAERLAAGRATELALLIGLREQYSGGPATDELHTYISHVIGSGCWAGSEGLVAALVTAQAAGEAERDDVAGMLYLLFSTAHLSSAPFIASAVLRVCLALDRDPGLRSDPYGWRSVVNESLRLDSALQISMPRFALEDMEIGGEAISKGDAVIVSNAAANRDPARFDAPDEFRPSRAVRSHLAFGHGVHFCIGAPLARLEGEIALNVLFHRFPTLRLATRAEDLEWVLGPMLRSLRRLPVFLRGSAERD